MTETLLNILELAEYVKKKREDEDLSIRQVSEITQISPSTLSRIENGVCTPDSDTLAKLTSWLGIPVDNLMRGELISQIPITKAEASFYKSTPDAVEAHLRADPNLNAETAKALAELFRVAYTQFSGSDFSLETKAETAKTSAKKAITKKQPYASRSRK